MPDESARIVRRHRKRTDDGKGHRRFIAGHRFRLPAGVGGRDADDRFLRLEALWKENEVFCRRRGLDVGWTRIALHAAEYVRRGDARVPLPVTDDILDSFAVWEKGQGNGCGGTLEIMLELSYLKQDESRTRIYGEYPLAVEDFTWEEALSIHTKVSMHFSSINWLVPEVHRKTIIENLEESAREEIQHLAAVQQSPHPDRSTPLVTGRLHQALVAFEAVRR